MVWQSVSVVNHGYHKFISEQQRFHHYNYYYSHFIEIPLIVVGVGRALDNKTQMNIINSHKGIEPEA